MYDDWELELYGFPREDEEVFQDPNMNHDLLFPLSVSTSPPENGIAQISAPTNSPRLEGESNANINLNSFEVIMKHFQNVRSCIESTKAIFESQISGLTPETNSDGFAIQEFDEAANLFQDSCDALAHTITKVHDRLAIASQSDEGGSDSGFESASATSYAAEVAIPSTSFPTIQIHQATLGPQKLETRCETLREELEQINQMTTWLNPQQTNGTQFLDALENYEIQMLALYSDLYTMRGIVLKKVATWQASKEMLVAELNNIQVLYRKTFEINEACRKQVSDLMVYGSMMRKKLRLTLIPASVVDLQNKFLSIHRDLISNLLVIEELPSRVLGLSNNLKVKVRSLLPIDDGSKLTGDPKKIAISATNLKAVVVTQEEMKKLNEATQNASWVQVAKSSSRHMEVGSPATEDEDGPSSSKKQRQSTFMAGVRRAFRKKMAAASGHASFVDLLIHGQNDAFDKESIELAYPDEMFPIEVPWVSGSNVTATFAKSKLGKNLKRAKRDKRDESVVDESLYLMFCTKVLETVHQGEIFVWTAPKSCRIVTNSSQIAAATSSIIWCDTCDISEVDASVADQYHRETLPSANLSLVLGDWLRDATKSEISSGQMKSLMRKLLSYPTVVAGQSGGRSLIQNGYITRSQFSKTKLHGKELTFWESLFATPKFVTKHLSGQTIGQTGPFQDGKISFASRAEVESELEGAKVGDYIVRFSEINNKENSSKIEKAKTAKNRQKPKDTNDIVAELAIAIDYVDNDNQIKHWGPLCARDLSENSLATHILQYKDLKCLYPERIPKEAHDGFGKYFVAVEPPKGYAKVVAFFEGLKVSNDTKGSSAVSGNSKTSSGTSAFKRGSRNQQEPSTSTCGNVEPSASVSQQIFSSQAVPSTSSSRGLPPISSVFHRPAYPGASPMPFTLQGHFPGPSLNPIAELFLPCTNSPVDSGNTPYYGQSNTMDGRTNGMAAATMNDFMPMDFQESSELNEFDNLIPETKARRRSIETEVQGRNLADGHMAPPSQWNYPSQMTYDGMGHDIIAQPK